jgi:hypothetical protein
LSGPQTGLTFYHVIESGISFFQYPTALGYGNPVGDMTGRVQKIRFSLLLLPEFCTQKPSVKFGTQLPKYSGSGNGCPKIQVPNQGP